MSKAQHTYSIAIVGAGIMGLMNAYTLSQEKHQITIYDPKGFPPHNASFIAGGMLAPYSEIEHMPMSYVEAGLESITLWKECIATLPQNIDFSQNGSLFIAHDQDRYMIERFATHLPQNAKWKHAHQKDVQQLEPQIAERFSSGLFMEEEAHIYPEQAMQALAAHLQENGMTYKNEYAEIDSLKRTHDYIIDCRGYDSEQDDQDLRGVKGELLIVENKEFKLSRAVRLMHPRYPLYIVPRPNNRFMIGATVIESAEDESVSLRSAMELMSALYSLHPSFGDAKVIDMLAGIRPSYADNLPRIKTQGNVISCNGSFRHGYLLSPAMARDVKTIINGRNSKSLFVDPDKMEKEAA